MFLQKYYDNYDNAVMSVYDGKTWGVLEFPPNYSNNLEIRINEGRSTNDSIVETSEVLIDLDMSSK